jgi:hypothetical protein
MRQPMLDRHPHRRRAISLLCVLSVTSAGCRQQVFDPDQQLPALRGVTARLDVVSGAEYTTEHGISGIAPDAVFIRQTIRNDTAQPLKVYATPLLQANRIVVRTPGGGKARLTLEGYKYRYPRRGDVGTSHVEPGDEKERFYELSRLFDLSDPGEYTVEVATRYTASGSPYATNPEPLTFTIPIK